MAEMPAAGYAVVAIVDAGGRGGRALSTRYERQVLPLLGRVTAGGWSVGCAPPTDSTEVHVTLVRRHAAGY